MKNLINKYYELIAYFVVGVMTTVINLIVYFMSTRLFNINELIANILAWTIALIFSFIMNKIFVFKSKSIDSSTILKEFTKFFSGRFATLLLDELIMFIGLRILNVNDILVQLVKQVIIIVLNYILGKLSFK